VDGHDVIVLDYRSTKPCPKSSCNLANTGNIGITALFLQGRLWIDAASSQLRRERWEIAGVHQTLPERIVVVRKEATYGESRFGILTPRRIVCDYYDRTGGTKQKPSMALAARITFDYGEFRKFEVATEETIETPVEAAR
jgi:hypothetical protein